jgi:hypothetical protein
MTNHVACSSPPHANSFVIGPAVIKHTHAALHLSRDMLLSIEEEDTCHMRRRIHAALHLSRDMLLSISHLTLRRRIHVI